MDAPYKLRSLKPDRGYLLFLTSGVFTYEMQLNEFHIEMAMQKKVVIVDSSNMTIFNPVEGDWFELKTLSEIMKYGQTTTNNDSEGKNTRIVAGPGKSEKRKKKRKADA